MTQVAAAKALGVSSSYYNQLENNQRSLTPPLIAKLSVLLDVGVSYWDDDDDGRLLADVREALSLAAPEAGISTTELREFALNHPLLARALVSLHARQRVACERLEAVGHVLAERGCSSNDLPPLAPHEEVRDFFYTRHNYIPALDQLAESIAAKAELTPGTAAERLRHRLERRHGLEIVESYDEGEPALRRDFDPDTRKLHVSHQLSPRRRAFQFATQLAFLEAGELIHELVAEASFSSEEARTLTRVGLAHHFAGALLMPYRAFHAAAEQLRYDIEPLRRQFQVGYETACHRLSTLQRPEHKGVPFFFLRVDRAGNISKRQSATDFHFSRVGGTCPLWNVYEAFSHPGQILRQIARMPDGRTYLWITRASSRPSGRFGTPDKKFAIGLGCDLQHAARLVYADGLDLENPNAATPIGPGCKICERRNCPQRAFPPLGRKLAIDVHRTVSEPYPFS